MCLEGIQNRKINANRNFTGAGSNADCKKTHDYRKVHRCDIMRCRCERKSTLHNEQQGTTANPWLKGSR